MHEFIAVPNGPKALEGALQRLKELGRRVLSFATNDKYVVLKVMAVRK